MSNDQGNNTTEKADDAEENNNSSILFVALAFILGFGYYAFTTGMFASLPDVEMQVPDELKKVVSVEQCESQANVYLNCVVTYKGSRGGIARNFFTTTSFDSNGVKLGEYMFPSQFLPPNQPSKELLITAPKLSNVAKVLIRVK